MMFIPHNPTRCQPSSRSHVLLPLRHLGKESGQHPAAFRRRLLIQLDGLFGLFPLELEEVFHLLLGELHMGHWLDAVVASDGQQALIGNGGMVDLDVRSVPSAP